MRGALDETLGIEVRAYFGKGTPVESARTTEAALKIVNAATTTAASRDRILED